MKDWMTNIRIGFCVLLLWCVSSHSSAQETNPGSIENLFHEQISAFPQEKLYIQTDRPSYITGETMWMRIHLVDAVFLKQANASRYVYVELLNPLAEVVERLMIRPDSLGLFYGHLLLDESLPEGNYTLRAYTWFMQNMGEENFFCRTIAVIDPLSTDKHSALLHTPSRQDLFDVSFFPEGGHASPSADIQMVFKALNADGLSEHITGTVYDDTGAECVSFESTHLGMGQFRMYYYPGRKYHAVCTNGHNTSKRFELPDALPGSVALKALWSRDRLRITLAKTPEVTLPLQTYLVAHIRGVVLYSEPWNEKQGFVVFDKEFFPAGVVHFMLVDEERNILSERLIFSSQKSTFANVQITPDKSNYKPRDKVTLRIIVTDENQTPLAGNFSLAVTDKQDVAPDSTITILSTLLLTSELEGHIESPMSYLQMDDRKTTQALDVLMMTQGWRRYNIPALLKGQLTKPLKYPVETNRVISGSVSGIFSSTKGGSLSLLAVHDSVIGTSLAHTDEQGRFEFKDIEYPDSTWYIVQAMTKKESQRVFIELDSLNSFPPVQLPFIPSRHDEMPVKEEYVQKSSNKYNLEHGMRMINLDDVEIIGTARPKNKVNTSSPYYSAASSSMVITEGDIEKSQMHTVFELLRRLPGISVVGEEVKYRGNVPILILDNVPEENFDYSNLDISDISDAFVSPPIAVSTIFGQRGANGAIVINTKKGFVQKNTLKKNMNVIKPIGYQQTMEFYAPVYETESDKRKVTSDFRTTIYWKPNVITDDSGTATLTFYAADTVSEYGVVMEGTSNLGHVIYSAGEVVNVSH